MPLVNFPLEVPSNTCNEMSPISRLSLDIGYVGQAIMVEVRGNEGWTTRSGLRGLQSAVAVPVVNSERGAADNDVLLAIAIEVACARRSGIYPGGTRVSYWLSKAFPAPCCLDSTEQPSLKYY